MQTTNPQADSLINEAIQTGATELFLSYLDIKHLPKKLFDLTQLTNLTLTGNQLESLPEDVCKLKNLKVLDLAGNLLGQLPSTICKLINLEQLDLASNKLTELPYAIGQLTHLTYLDCFSNNLLYLPESLGNCHHLHTLRLGQNDLRELPEDTGNLHDLKILDIAYNNLEDLPTSLTRLKQLRELQLNGNLLDISFHDLASLTYKPSQLIETFFSIKQTQQIQQEKDILEQQIKQRYDQRVSQWISEQQQVIKQNNWIKIASITLPLSIQANLAEISQQLDLISLEVAIVCHLISNEGENNHFPVVEIIESLKNINNHPNKSGFLNNIATKLPLYAHDQECHSLQLITSTEDRSKNLRLEITCSSKIKQALLGIYLSLLEMLKSTDNAKDINILVTSLTSPSTTGLKAPSVVFDATLKQVNDVLSNHKYCHNVSDPEKIATGMILLASSK